LVASLSHFFLGDSTRRLPEWFAKMVAVNEFEARLQSPEFCSLVYEVDEQIVGYISVKQRLQIYHLFVSEQHQHKGIARALWFG
jgi:ribosomal protein S18 acetylase RimI-like enzyme